ncbi:MAG: hypothetical protein K9H84_04880 [Bacteroidales bacterium]|nr:hypothetical protein [Bacteroidales bacterium]
MRNQWINRITGIYMFLFVYVPAIMAQKPSNLPKSNGEPVDFFGSLTNIIVYIVLPLIIIVLFAIWRNRKIKENIEKQKKQEQDKSNQKKS